MRTLTRHARAREARAGMVVPALCRAVAEVVGVAASGIGGGTDFVRLGGTGTDSAAVLAVLRAYGAPPDLLVTHPRIGDAAAILAAHPVPTVSADPATRAPGAHPVSFQQRARLELAARTGPATHRRHAHAVVLTGADPARLLTALALIGQRHPALRTGIRHTPVGWQQLIHPRPVLDVDPTPVTGPGDARRRALDALAGSRFDHTGGAPLARWTLAGTGPILLLVLVADELVCDTRSWRALLRELALAYRAPDEIGPPPPSPGDYTRWQRQLTPPQVYQQQLGWWTTRLGGYEPGLLAPAGSASTGPSAGLRVSVPLSATVTHGLGGGHASLLRTLITLTAVHVGAWAGAGDVVVATELASRTDSLAATVGMIAATRPHRLHLTGARDRHALAETVRDWWAQGWHRGAVPIEDLSTELDCDLDAVAVSYAGQPRGTLPVIGTEPPVPLRLPPTRQHRTLDIAAQHQHGVLTLRARYRTDRIQRRATQRILHAITTDLRALTTGARTR
ncbi:condensation domain-containing protein [Nocardia puris]|uniref:condensation domain-containing protein n=1 Tax=Nocardia puris TaxID=208602 RepID=UPI002E1E723E